MPTFCSSCARARRARFSNRTSRRRSEDGIYESRIYPGRGARARPALHAAAWCVECAARRLVTQGEVSLARSPSGYSLRDMVEVTIHFRSPADELGPTSFTRDREHAKQRQVAAQSGQASNRSVQVPRQVRLRDGREGYDATQAELSVVAELLSGKGRGFVLLPHESAVTDWHDADQITSVYCAEVQELVERVLPGLKVLTIGNHIIRTEEPEKYKNPTPTVFVRLTQPLLMSPP